MIRCRTLIVVAAALALVSCGPVDRPATSGAIAVAADGIDQVQTRYDTARAFAGLLLPLLPAKYVDRIRALDAQIVAALARARRITDAAAQANAIAEAKRALDAYDRATSGGD